MANFSFNASIVDFALGPMADARIARIDGARCFLCLGCVGAARGDASAVGAHEDDEDALRSDVSASNGDASPLRRALLTTEIARRRWCAR